MVASVHYTKPSQDPLQDLAGNDAQDFQTNRVMVVDQDRPELEGAQAAGSALFLYYNEILDPQSVPATSDFTVTVNRRRARRSVCPADMD